ncbi:MAG: protoporphyrinogen oxidase [Opitutus sp.]
MAASKNKSIAILGAGITGLVAAHRLTQLGHHVRIFEQSSRIGGAIRSERADGWLIEAGPNSIMTGEPALTKLLSELDLDSKLMTAAPLAKHRYIVRRGRAVIAPLSPPAFLGSPLFSFGAKLRILAELRCRPRVRTSDVALADFIRGHFGGEFVDYALDPMVSGVYAGNPARLSARHAFPKLWEMEQKHGSLLRGQSDRAKARRAAGVPAPRIVSFADGLQVLPEAIAARLPAGCVAFNSAVEAITPGNGWNVIWNQGEATHTQAFDGLILALPAPALARLRIGSLGERPLAAMESMEHPSVSSLFLGYRREQVQHPLDGFGMLVPSVEKRSILGVLFSSSLFPGRAPEGHVALTVMIGGSRQSEIAALPLGELLLRIHTDLDELVGVKGKPEFVRHTLWPRAIPQYNLGYEQYPSVMAAVELSHPGLFIGGQARDGIALPACIAAGEKLAARADV